ncbi:MAG: tyrosine-type recombinase/integrase [Bacteroidales bacterium]|nr:tyrosine-type recombinase/integrase [Bacteroidales bacterium]
MIDYQDFITYLQTERRMSVHTVEAYSKDLGQFFTFLEEVVQPKTLNDITPDDVRTWIITLLEDKGDTARTVNRKLSSLKAFFRYQMKMENVKTNPMASILSPKIKKRLPEYVEQNDMQRLFSSDLFAEDFEGRRDQVIIELFYATGIRLSELLNLHVQDIDLSQNTIKVLGKRNKERIIPFGENMHDLFTMYLDIYQKKFHPGLENYCIFVAANGKQLYPKAVYRIVRKYLDMVTTIDKRSPHVIRHTFATHMLNNGADLNAIKTILGHSSLAATQVYTHNSMEQLKSIYKQAHPRA